MRGLLCVLVLLAACARPLTPAERAFSATLHGTTLNADRVRLHRVPRVSPFAFRHVPRPARTCRERIRPPLDAPVRIPYAAVALFERLAVDRRYWSEDFLSGYPTAVDLAQAMFLAHELTHVWQWQNRARTGYHPFRAAREHAPAADPYDYDLAAGRDFLSYGYEQQASLVEEFVCCRALAPEGARTDALYRLLAPVFPGIARRGAVPPDAVRLSWAEAPRGGICE